MKRRVHCGPEQPRIQPEVLRHSLLRLLVRLQHSLIHLLRTARFADALTRLLTLLTPSRVGK